MKRLRIIMYFSFTLGLILILSGLFIIRKNDVLTIINSYFGPNKTEVKLDKKNEYYREYDFMFVKNTDNFTPSNYQEILNLYYTFINSGNTNFEFYCSENYEDCLIDIQALANDKSLLSDINNYTHPYNSFQHIETEYDSFGKVKLELVHTYDEKQIKEINNKIDELYPKLVNESLSEKENIKSIHDYIINNAKYDSDRSDRNVINYDSDIAYGPLFEGYAICGGYTDLMELFLEKMNIKSFKISSDSHIWNAVLLDNKWYHLDLTWDDPVASDGLDYLEHNYFLIDTDTLLNKEVTQHIFNQDVYQELRQN